MMKESDHHREVYAFAGLALYMTQILEAVIVNAIVCFSLIETRKNFTNNDEWQRSVDKLMTDSFKLSMGTMIKYLKKSTVLPEEFVERMDEVKKKRNYFVHHYFRKGIISFFGEKGRDNMIEELKGYRDLFAETIDIINDMIQPIKAAHGLTDKTIDQVVSEMTERYLREIAPEPRT